jgi:hypothetical protein
LAGLVATTTRSLGSAAPLAWLFLALPLWWALGLTAVAPLVIAALLARQMVRRGVRVDLPAGFSWWLLFLAWVLLGAALLWVDAPGAVPGGGPGRLLVYGDRLGWYVACTVVLLWIGNSSRTALPDRTVHGLVGALFVIAAAGGVLGLLAPTLEFRSAVEWVLPGGLRSNGFVRSLVHPETADIQFVLGRPEARPKAPFAFTNTWGSMVALSVVFLAAFALRSGARIRIAALAALGVALVPVAYSLNRGLWACLVLGLVGALLLVLVRARPAVALTVIVGTAIAAVLVLGGPLGTLVQERMANQHSNERRGALLTATVESVSTGSPLAGFGSTRDVQGSFASISGGATPDCPACGVPPMGTQGQLWLVLFSHGWLGLAFFLLFVLAALARTVRCRTLNETVATFVLGFFLLQIFIYDTLGLPLMLVMIAIGLVWRERRETAVGGRAWTAAQLAERVRAGAPVVLALVVVGAALGWYVAPDRDRTTYASEARIALTTLPVYLSAGLDGLTDDEQQVTRPREITIDTEGALVLSEETLDRAMRGQETDDTARLREALTVTAEPTTDILVLRLVSDDGPEARAGVEAVARSYLTARHAYLDRRRDDLVSELRRAVRELPATSPASSTTAQQLNTAIERLLVDRQSVGRVVAVSPARREGTDVTAPVVSGAALGLLLGVGIAAARSLSTGIRPLRSPTRRRRAALSHLGYETPLRARGSR